MKLLVELFKLLSTKCTYWVTADTVYFNFSLPTWQMKQRFSFGAKQQHRIMVPPPRHGKFGGEDEVSYTWQEEEICLKWGESWRCSTQMLISYNIQYVDLSFHTQNKTNQPFLSANWVLAGLFILIKKIFKIFKGNKIYTNATLIFFINQSDFKHYWQVLMWFSYKS